MDIKAEEYLNKNGYKNSSFFTKDHVEIVMEQYASIKTKELESEINRLDNLHEAERGLRLNSNMKVMKLEQEINRLKEEKAKIKDRWEALSECADIYLKYPIKSGNEAYTKEELLQKRLDHYHGLVVKFTSVLDSQNKQDENNEGK